MVYNEYVDNLSNFEGVKQTIFTCSTSKCF